MTLPVFLHIEATLNPDETAALEAYSSKVPAVAKAHGAVPIATYDVEAALDQQPAPDVFVVVSFTTRGAIQAFFDDPAYQALIPVRDKAFAEVRFYVTSERV